MNILKSITVFAISVFFGPVASYYEGCISERCFTISRSNETKNFNDAKTWCNDRKSSLAIVNDGSTQAALTEFLNSAQLSEQPKSPMFIDLKLELKNRTWYLVNGTSYLGGLVEQNAYVYWYYGYIKFHSNEGLFYLDGSIPNSLRNFICEFDGSRCSNNSRNYYPYKGKCFIKYENESLTWYYARERCKSNGGDLATFNYDSGTLGYPNDVPFNTTWLNSALSYWVGIRYRDWQWKSSGGDDEIIFTRWSSNKPNNISYECVCVDPNGNPAWGWTDCSCTEPRQFVCIKIVPTTIATTTTTTPPTTTSRTTSFPVANYSPSTNALAIGLGAGIGGGVFLILLIVLIVLAVTLTRRRRRKNNGVESRHKVENTRVATTPNTEPAPSNGSDVYAHVVPTTHHPADNKPRNDVIYSTPEFSTNQNSTSAGSDPTSLCQGKVQSIMLEGSNDVYANATVS